MGISVRGASRLAARQFRPARLACTFGMLLGLAACGPDYDPLTREGVYQPAHTNRSNLTLMVANPADLVRGTGATGGDGQIAAAAVDRLRTDKVKKLPASDISQLSTGNSGENSGSGGQ